MISVCINTAALAPHAKHVMSSGGVPYSWRAYALKNFILPRYVGAEYIDEVIVTGIWEEGEGYTYVHVPAQHFNWADCIEQRHAGFEASSGDVLVFQHDDHMLDLWLGAVQGWDVISPARYTRARTFSGERLNAGEADGYIDGHCSIYKREVIERCPWSNVPRAFTMDIAHTKQVKAAGFNIVWTDNVRCWDVEYGSTPW